jgi:hypothetical protein
MMIVVAQHREADDQSARVTTRLYTRFAIRLPQIVRLFVFKRD